MKVFQKLINNDKKQEDSEQTQVNTIFILSPYVKMYIQKHKTFLNFILYFSSKSQQMCEKCVPDNISCTRRWNIWRNSEPISDKNTEYWLPFRSLQNCNRKVSGKTVNTFNMGRRKTLTLLVAVYNEENTRINMLKPHFQCVYVCIFLIDKGFPGGQNIPQSCAVFLNVSKIFPETFSLFIGKSKAFLFLVLRYSWTCFIRNTVLNNSCLYIKFLYILAKYSQQMY